MLLQGRNCTRLQQEIGWRPREYLDAGVFLRTLGCCLVNLRMPSIAVSFRCCLATRVYGIMAANLTPDSLVTHWYQSTKSSVETNAQDGLHKRGTGSNALKRQC